jgi:hypothetical protein
MNRNRMGRFILSTGLFLFTLAGFTVCAMPPDTGTESDRLGPVIKLTFHIKNETDTALDIGVKYGAFSWIDNEYSYREQPNQGPGLLGAKK